MEKQTFTIHDLAVALDCARPTILAHRAGQRHCRLLDGLPEPVQQRPRLLWLRADIEAWLADKRTYRPATATTETLAPAPRRGPGRPRKAAQAGGGGGGAV